MQEKPIVHEITPDGESQEKWAINTVPGFRGSIKQITLCARCGRDGNKGPTDKLIVGDRSRPTMHVLCRDCYEGLPA